jgi:ankyrin repeat protein
MMKIQPKMHITRLDLDESCIESIEKNDLEKVMRHVSSGLSINSFLMTQKKVWDTNCFTILAIASFCGSINIVKFLIEHNVKVNKCDASKNRSAIHWAVISNNYEIVELLIKANADINARDRDQLTPLILATNNGNYEITKLLIQNGANVNVRDRMNSSSLHYACLRSHFDIAHYLIINGSSSYKIKPFNIFSPLKYLLINEKYYTAKLLIETGYCDNNNLKNEKWIKDGKIGNTIINENFLNWVKRYTNTSPSLMHLCRRHIRQKLGDEFVFKKIDYHFVDILPKNLINFLKMEY